MLGGRQHPGSLIGMGPLRPAGGALVFHIAPNRFAPSRDEPKVFMLGITAADFPESYSSAHELARSGKGGS
jgi:hypothetical protein